MCDVMYQTNAPKLEEIFRSLPAGENIIATIEGAVLRTNVESEERAAKIAFSVSKMIASVQRESSNVFEAEHSPTLFRLNTSDQELVVSLLSSTRFVLISLLSTSSTDTK